MKGKKDMLQKFASAQKKKKISKEKKISGNFRHCERQFWKRHMTRQRC